MCSFVPRHRGPTTAILLSFRLVITSIGQCLSKYRSHPPSPSPSLSPTFDSTYLKEKNDPSRSISRKRENPILSILQENRCYFDPRASRGEQSVARKGAGWYSRPGPESTGGGKSRADRGRLPAARGRGRASERRDGKRGEAEEAVDEM